MAGTASGQSGFRSACGGLALAWMLADAALSAPAGTGSVLHTRHGPVEGTTTAGITHYADVPYAADTAATRFQPPQPPVSWSTPRGPVTPRPICPQPLGSTPPAGTVQTEDCLRLNVWTPATRADGVRRPVLVYFHGGGYNHGSVSEPLYDGHALARRGDVVVVTVNHRLNGYGYLDVSSLDADPRWSGSGNAGQLDLVLALRWVRDHAQTLGGDPQRVTIFGQSGGGAKCATLMAMPAARGLFQRVWTMSGQQVTGRRRSAAARTTREVMARAGVDTLAALQALSMDELQAAFAGGTWAPVVDGAVLPRDPFSPDAPQQSRHIPMVLGNTLDETTSLIGPQEPALFNLQADGVAQALQRHVAPFLGSLQASEVAAQYAAWMPQATPAQQFFAATTAARSWRGMLIEAERRAVQGAPTWTYYLHWQSPLEGGRWGAPHTLDIPLVFGTLAHSPYTAADPAGAAAVSAAMMDALLHFARQGEPQVPNGTAWPRFDLKRRSALVFDTQIKRVHDPRRRERLLFAPVPYVQPGTW